MTGVIVASVFPRRLRWRGGRLLFACLMSCSAVTETRRFELKYWAVSELVANMVLLISWRRTATRAGRKSARKHYPEIGNVGREHWMISPQYAQGRLVIPFATTKGALLTPPLGLLVDNADVRRRAYSSNVVLPFF